MTDHCPTCGSPVRVVSTDEGTSHFEPMPIPEGLDTLRALSEAATPGPWHDRSNHKPYRIVVFGGKRAYDLGYTTSDLDAADAALIVAAVNYVRERLTD